VSALWDSVSAYSKSTIVAGLLGAFLIYYLAYGLFFGPTRHIPGPFVTRFSKVPFYCLLFSGTLSADIHDLHKKYGYPRLCFGLMLGPVLRIAPDLVDVQLAEATLKGWGGHNENKQPWDKDPLLCKIVRHGLPADNVISISSARESRRMRRLIGPPFAKKFLIDQEHVLKECVKKVIMNVESLREINADKVDMMHQYKKYTLDALSTFLNVKVNCLAEFAFGGFFCGDLIESGVNEFQLMDDGLICSVARMLIYLTGRYSQPYFRQCLPFVVRHRGGNWHGHVRGTSLNT